MLHLLLASQVIAYLARSLVPPNRQPTSAMQPKPLADLQAIYHQLRSLYKSQRGHPISTMLPPQPLAYQQKLYQL